MHKGIPSAGGSHRRSAVSTERDRFIGFAFAAAHLLLEVDRAGLILFATGARCRLTERDTAELIDRSLFEIVAPGDRMYVRELLGRLSAHQRINPSRVVFNTVDGDYFAALLGGCCLPSSPDLFQLSILLSAPARAADLYGALGGGMLDRRGFTDILGERLVSAQRKGLERCLTLMEIKGFGERVDALDFEGAQALMGALDAFLRSVSADGDSAARLSDDRFGLVHGIDISDQDIRKHITGLLGQAGLGLRPEATRTWALAPGRSGLDSQDATRALIYTVQSFATEENEFAITSLETGARLLLDQTVQRIDSLRQTIRDRAFHVVYQPIVDIGSGRLRHVEALARLEGGTSSHAFVHFAEHVGMICDFDLLVCQTVLETMNRHAANPALPDVAINLSAQTLTSPVFLEQFRRVVAPYGNLTRKLMIEVTEAVAVTDLASLNRTLQKLRKFGHKVCLDDVGSGNAPFQALHALKVDIAKLDGQIVRAALQRRRDMTLLKAVAEACRQLDLEIIGEQVENADQLKLLTAIGVPLGQGYLFGRPERDFTTFLKPRS
jgi:EAL domain-containing protein (putative c-di-GMP-specific phosphodiesterase class I)